MSKILNNAFGKFWYWIGKICFQLGYLRHASNGLLKSANYNNKDAQLGLGISFWRGHGVQQNDKEAFHWFRLSAAQGNPSAQAFLALCYQSGRGVKMSYTDAIAWYTKSAESGNRMAQHNLGLMYQLGQGVPIDECMASKYFRDTQQDDTKLQARSRVMENELTKNSAKSKSMKLSSSTLVGSGHVDRDYLKLKSLFLWPSCIAVVFLFQVSDIAAHRTTFIVFSIIFIGLIYSFTFDRLFHPTEFPIRKRIIIVRGLYLTAIQTVLWALVVMFSL